MRRSERQVTEISELLSIIDDCSVCRLGMSDGEGMYIVPMNFGYEYVDETLNFYFHSAKQGRKISAMAADSRVCFEMDCSHKLLEGERACDYSYEFRSLVGSGLASFVEEPAEKARALSLLMKHQTGKDFEFDDKMTASVAIIKVRALSFSGKKYQK